MSKGKGGDAFPMPMDYGSCVVEKRMHALNDFETLLCTNFSLLMIYGSYNNLGGFFNEVTS